ncbi:uncharacterized protein LOC101238613 [Trichonephila clavipes]|nr:uncharacterized protein LOC101238613 [Trichonephila clavipes]
MYSTLNKYYGDGDSKGYESVKNFYGINTVTKLECIVHVQKRVGGWLRQLKKTTKGLGGKNKLTDKLIDRIQNYYGIAIRSNVGNLQKMMSSVIAAFFHCVSGKNNSLLGQCPEESESWCRYQRAKAAGSPLKEIEQGLPNKIINQIKPTYLKLCNETLLKKCLHGNGFLRNFGVPQVNGLYGGRSCILAQLVGQSEWRQTILLNPPYLTLSLGAVSDLEADGFLLSPLSDPVFTRRLRLGG